MNAAIPSVTAHFAALAPGYDVLLCDIWGVVHNGVVAHPAACDALVRFRAQGGRVVLITNAPRPSGVVAGQLNALHVPRGAYDGIVSSGDVTRAVIQARSGQSVFHLGPQRDVEIFAGLGVHFAPLESADYVVCTGLDNDEIETPDNYRSRFAAMLTRDVFMVCANPDVVVERGPTLVYCAGALADLYAGMGGKVLYAGKPHRPIYDQALALTPGVQLGRVLAIGDSVRTDLTGAHAFGVDFLFVTAGIHGQELGARDNPDSVVLRNLFTAAGQPPKAVMHNLAW